MGAPTVLLFDLDGTLVLTGGAGRRAMRAAFEAHTGKGHIFEGFRFGGMTDLGIARAGLELAERDYDDALVEAIFARYLEVLPEEVARSSGYRVLPHVRDVLDEVSGLPDVAVGLGTGNLEPGARIKLSRAELGHYFGFGGFGSDAEDRAALLRAGAERGAAELGAPLEQCRVLVIGDTPRDVVAAHAIGAFCVTVATGGCSAAELGAAGADVVLGDLGAWRSAALLER